MSGKNFILLIFWGSLIYACKDTANNNKAYITSDVIGSHIDSSVHPGDDFFQYANGGWLKKNPIPASETGWGIFNLVEDENLARIKKISEEASGTNATKGTPTQQIGDFFFAGMDSVAIEKAGISPLNPLITKINNAQSITDLLACISELQTIQVAPLFDTYVGQDMKNSNKNMLYLSQGGLGLPNRDYYFNTDARTKMICAEYVKHISKMLTYVYEDTALAQKASAIIFELEKKLANIHKKLEALRDPYANYNKMSVAALNARFPNFAWTSLLPQMGASCDSVIVGQPAFFALANSLLKSLPLANWKHYLTWHLVSSYAPYMSSQFDKEHFAFYNTIMSGSKEQRPRWKRVLDAQEDALGDALGQLFVKEYFPEKTKKRYELLTEQIVESYREHIQKLDWMTDNTKQKAIKKLNAITKKIGYPTTWKDYSKMNISRESYTKNIIEANKWHANYNMLKLTKPVDRNEWSMTPQTYNAYYNPSNNEIVLPAAIFTAPGYRDEDIDDAVIYGYVGASTIGHELTHGFDDEGRQFDELGNLKNWWSKADEEQFKKKASMLVEQFNKYVVLDSLHPNGKATLGENIADLGGVVIGLDAFKKTTQYKENKPIAGLMPIQRYFLGYAYGWMQQHTKEMLATQLLTDVHAPIFLRVNGPMSNCDEWYKAFNVTQSHKMYRDSTNRVRIW